jgi:predicted transcriptional regulator of viral defense system
MVMVEGNSLRTREKNGVRLGFYTRTAIPQRYLERVLTKTGYMSISNPELTALDLVARMRESGGLNRVVEVLEELVESMDYSDIGDDYYHLSRSTAIQRLGYLLERELGNQALADSLYRGAESAGAVFRTVPLVIGKRATTTRNLPFDQKWQLVINEEVETD